MVGKVIHTNLYKSVIPTISGYPHPPKINRVNPELFGEDNVTISLEWTNSIEIAYYINITPPVPIMHHGKTNASVTVLYNTPYNVSMVGSLCGQNSTHSATEIYFGMYVPLL